MINGIMVIHKQVNFTSLDAVAKLRGICGQKKMGHTGTLDPMATGVLPVCLGNATKICDMIADRDKEYVAGLQLGVETDTQDTTGKVLAEYPVTVSAEEIRGAAASFVGEYWQVPPMYSALKVNGRKLYELARAGQEVERKARPITIHELEVLECDPPTALLRVVCSKGTYVRTLCADIGAKLGCGGAMRSLTRTRVGEFRLEDAHTLGELQRLKDEGMLGEILLPTDSVFAGCPALHVLEDAVRLLENGNAVTPEQTAEGTVHAPGEWVRMYRPDHSFAGVYAYAPEREWYKPVKMFLEKE